MLFNTSKDKKTFVLDEKKLVINLSNHNLTDAQNYVLALGLNFATNLKEVPYSDIITNTELVSKSLPQPEGQQLREVVKECLNRRGQNPPPPIPTLSREEREAVRSLKESKEIVVLPADKGNATVIMNKDDYTSQIRNLLYQNDYKITKGNPTNRFTNSIKKALEDILQTNNISPELAQHLIPKNPTTPQIYGLPKIHKMEVPLRPIVCTIGSATYNLAKELNRILSLLLEKRTVMSKILPVLLAPSLILIWMKMTYSSVLMLRVCSPGYQSMMPSPSSKID